MKLKESPHSSGWVLDDTQANSSVKKVRGSSRRELSTRGLLIFYLSKILARVWFLSLIVILLGRAVLPFVLQENMNELEAIFLLLSLLLLSSILLIATGVTLWEPIKSLRLKIYDLWEKKTIPFDINDDNTTHPTTVEYEVADYEFLGGKIVRQSLIAVGFLFSLSLLAFLFTGSGYDTFEILNKEDINISYLGAIVSIFLGRIVGVITLTSVAVFPRLDDGLIVVAILGMFSLYAAPSIKNTFVASEEIIFKHAIKTNELLSILFLCLTISILFLFPLGFINHLTKLPP
ncbi:hypothetical protein [Halostella salina]|uniref:hypothetical protein n=1 Tax=Halostella salina TaxID=1547897 RepID=UPI0013CE5B31|nr:hypothetical protein [Halostella salina]